jgi:hypothetical protein
MMDGGITVSEIHPDPNLGSRMLPYARFTHAIR